ncbi:MAG: hypothetical protein IJU90_05205 [Bacteroidales bacterium]|nr:hypothetical protein [Bacteroidales bacterium]
MKKISIMLLALALASSMQAQWKAAKHFSAPSVHNVSIAIEGGLGGLMIDKSLGAPTKLGFNAGGGIGYTFYFAENYGVHTGFSFSYISSGYSAGEVHTDLTIDSIETWDAATTHRGRADVTSTTTSVEEKYTTMLLELPIQFAYSQANLWLNAGVRLSVPLSVNATYTYGPTSTGITHFYETDTYVAGNPIPLEGGLTLNGENGSYSAHKMADKLSVFVTLSVEAGYRFPIDATTSVYVGAFVDYGINSYTTEDNEQFISTLTNNGTKTTRFNGALKSTATESFKNLATGIRAYYNFGLGKTVR